VRRCVDENLRLELLALDPGATDCRLLPTLLAYHRLEPTREVHMGQLEAEAARDPDYATCVVRGLKRRLGQSGWKFPVIPFQQPELEVAPEPGRGLGRSDSLCSGSGPGPTWSRKIATILP
jgi:hypothetical protein